MQRKHKLLLTTKTIKMKTKNQLLQENKIIVSGKKIVFSVLLFLGLQSFAQKTVYIFNFSSSPVTIGNIGTVKATISGTTVTMGYPKYVSHDNPSGPGTPSITIPVGGSYTLENTANPNKFPFVSIGNTPAISQWTRKASATSSATVTAATAFTVGTTQMFEYIKFSAGSGGSGVLYNPAFWNNQYYPYPFPGVLNATTTNAFFASPNYGLSSYIGNVNNLTYNPTNLYEYINHTPGINSISASIEYDAPNGIYGLGSYTMIISISDN